MKVLILFLVVCCLSIPVLGVNRLFVDEITGYTFEDVTATNAHTDLLVVDFFTVENGVVANGGNSSHFVDTPGKISFNVSFIDFSANETVEITSVGSNVGLSGESIELGSEGDFTFSSVEGSFIGQTGVLGNIGGVFSSFGTRADVTSVGDIRLTAAGDTFFGSQDRIVAQSDTVRFEGGTGFHVNSEESNLFLKSLQALSFTARNNTTFQAASGLEIGSSHGVTSFTGRDYSINAENFVLAGRSSVEFDQTGDVTLTTQSIAGDVFWYSERIFLSGANLNLDVNGEGASTVIETSGTLQVKSNEFAVASEDIVLLAVDSIRQNAVEELRYTATDSGLVQSASTLTYGANAIEFQSTNDVLQIQVNGASRVNAINNNIIMDSATGLSYTAVDSLLDASKTLNLEANTLNLDVTSVIDFFSFTDLNLNANTATFTGSSAEFYSNVLTSWEVTGSTTFSSSGIYASSSGDIVFQGSANYRASADSITYYGSQTFAHVETFTVNSQDISTIAKGTLNFLTSGSTTWATTDLFQESSKSFALFSQQSIKLAAGNNLALIGSTTGNIAISAEGQTSFTSTDQIVLNSDGNFAITSQFDQTIEAATAANLDSRNLIISAEDLTLNGNDLSFSAPNIYSFLPLSVSSTGDVDVTSDQVLSFGTGSGRGQTVKIDSGAFSDTQESILIQGYSLVDFDANQINLSGQPVEFSVGFDKDLVFTADASIDFGARQTQIGAEQIDFRQDSLFELAGTNGLTIDVVDLFQIDTNIAVFDAQTLKVSDFGELLIRSNNALALEISGDQAPFDVTAGKLLDFFSHQETLLNVNGQISFSSKSFDAFSNQWNLDVGSFSSSSKETNIYFNNLLFNTDALDLSGTESVDLESVVSNSFSSVDDLSITTEHVTFRGGDIYIESGDGMFFSSGDDLYLGSIRSSTANPNYDMFGIFAAESITGTSDSKLDVFASNREDFFGIALYVQGLESTTVQTDNGDVYWYGANGVLISSTLSYTANAGSDIQLYAYDAIKAFSYGDAANNVDLQSTFSFEWDSSKFLQILADQNIESTSGTDTSFSAQLEINVQTLESTLPSRVAFYSTEGDISYTGQAWQLTAGRNEQNANSGNIRVDISAFDIDTPCGGTFAFGDDVLFRALGDQLLNQGIPQIGFIGGTQDDDSSYTITVGEQIGLYSSGFLRLTAAGSLEQTAGKDLSWTSADGSLSLREIDGLIQFTSARDFLAEANGLAGDVQTTVEQAATFGVTDHVASLAQGSILINAGTDLTVTSTKEMFFNSTNDFGGVKYQGVDLSVVASAANVNADILLTGKNTQFSANDAITINSPAINFGLDNKFTPQMVANVNDFLVSSTGKQFINALSDNILHRSDQSFTITSATSTFTAGGQVRFAADDELNLLGNTAVTVTASAFVDTRTGNGAGSTVQSAAGQLFLKSSGSKTGNGFLVSTDNNVGFSAMNYNQTITTTAKISTGTGSFLIGNDLIGTSQSLTFSVDGGLEFSGNNVVTQTTAANSRIELITEGQNGDIEFGGESFAVTSSDDFFLIADSVLQRSAKYSMSAVNQNSGKILMTSSESVGYSVLDAVSITGANDLFFETLGPESDLSVRAYRAQVNTLGDISYETEPAQGGSAFFLSENDASQILLTGTLDWNVDIDGSFNVDTAGEFTIQAPTNGAFELQAGDYAEWVVPESFSDESAIVFLANNEDGTQGDVYFNAEQAQFYSNSWYSAMFAALGNMLSNSDSIDVQLSGNSTNPISDSGPMIPNNLGPDDPLLGMTTEHGSLEYSAENGVVGFQAYGELHFLAEQSESAGYMQFVAGDQLNVESSHRGGHFVADTAGVEVRGSEVNFLAYGTNPETGYIKIVNDNPDQDPEAIYAEGNVPVFPQVNIRGGLETRLDSYTGDIRAEYAYNLLIYGGDIDMIAGRAIEFNVRGDGRLITPVFDFVADPNPSLANVADDAILFDRVSSVHFKTNGRGEILVASNAGDVLAHTNVTLIRSDVGGVHIQSSGSVGLISERQDYVFKGVSFESNWDIQVNASDGNIVLHGGRWRHWSSSTNGRILWESNNGHIDVDIYGDFQLFAGSVRFAGDTDITFTAGEDILFRVEDIAFHTVDDLHVQYGNVMSWQTQGSIVVSIQPEDLPPVHITDYRGAQMTRDGGVVHLTSRATATDDQLDMLDDINPRVNMPEVTVYTTTNLESGIQDWNWNFFIAPGGWCPYDRLLGFGQNAQQFVGFDFDSPGSLLLEPISVCVCLDNVWLCTHANAPDAFDDFTKIFRPYDPYYDTYRGRLTVFQPFPIIP